MLQTLHIRDFIIVETLELEFKQGFTVLTGETGAGKSILIDALSLTLGARAEAGIVRRDCDRAEISASFYIADIPACHAYLNEHELPFDDDNLLIRRVIYADGRSRALINGAAATISQLKEIGEFLVDIYSQHQHHALLKNTTQRQILDDYASLQTLVVDVASSYGAWQKLNGQRLSAEKNASSIADELADVRDMVRELKQLAPTLDEWLPLQQEHSKLSNGAEIFTACELSRDVISDHEISALSQLAIAQHKLSEQVVNDPQLQEALDGVDSAMISLEETARSLNKYLSRAELDPERLTEIENRIQALHSTARKYRTQPEQLEALLLEKQARLDELSSMTDDGALAKLEAQALNTYHGFATELSAKRQLAAVQMATKITQEMQRLSLAGGQFKVALLPQNMSAQGNESIEFLVAGHSGVEARPLNKVASGGELSRISLAIRVTTASLNDTPTMIFDEVDVGIGGGVAEVVGQLLKQIGTSRQALVITHLPQVAAQGAQHLQVSKMQANNQTTSHIRALNHEERVLEIARMLGGVAITETTKQHALEMLENGHR